MFANPKIANFIWFPAKTVQKKSHGRMGPTQNCGQMIGFCSFVPPGERWQIPRKTIKCRAKRQRNEHNQISRERAKNGHKMGPNGRHRGENGNLFLKNEIGQTPKRHGWPLEFGQISLPRPQFCRNMIKPKI